MMIENDALISKLHLLLNQERTVTVDFLLHLAEFDRRELYLSAGHSSCFDFCLRALHLTKPQAYLRITCARLLARFPAAAEFLRDGRLSISTLAMLKDLLTDENHLEVFHRATQASKEDVELMLLDLQVEKLQKSVAPVEHAGLSRVSERGFL